MAADDDFNPLTADTLARINAGCEECARARAYLAKVAQAGHPVEQQQQTVEAADAYLRSVKSLFFPGSV